MQRASFWIPVSLIVLLGFFLASCNKNGYTTKPQLKITSINTLIHPGETLTVVLTYTSKKGDLGGGTFVAIRNRLNQDPLLGTAVNVDTVTGPIPNFPDKPSAEFDFTEDWATYLHQSDAENDTIVFKFAAIDRAGNSSDTITTPKIVVLYQ